MVSFHVFILAWCLAWLWGRIENIKGGGGARNFIIIPTIGVILSLSVWSYLYANDGDRMHRKVTFSYGNNSRKVKTFSFLEYQRRMYPKWVDPGKMKENVVTFARMVAVNN